MARVLRVGADPEALTRVARSRKQPRPVAPRLAPAEASPAAPAVWKRRSARVVAAASGVAILGLLAWLALRGPAAVKREAGLDVLLITIDTLRADALGAYGNARVATPWIDRLAAAGVRFDQAHAQNVVTLPSHANILAGLYPLDHGVRDNSGFRFPKSTDTLATLLKARGYRTAAFISAFPLASRFGLERGFDVYDDRFLSADSGSVFGDQERHAPQTIAAALRWWQSQDAGPRFLWVHLFEPHFPYEPPEPFASRFRERPYLGEVSAADAALEPLLRPLLDAGAQGRTLTVLTGDHGESLGEHGERTHGIFAYETTLHIPLILFCPRLLRPRAVADAVRHVDLVPTILDALELPIPPGLSGRSLLPLAAGRRSEAAPSYFEALSGMTNRRWAPLYGVLRDRLKYIDLPLPELYDLARDPSETRNLAASRPLELEAMRSLLERLRSSDRGVNRIQESSETRERLRALGYLAAGGTPTKAHYTADDDPKRLIALDAELQTVAERHRAGDLAGALALCEDIVRRSPAMPLGLTQLAALQREQGDLARALATARRALASSPEDAATAALLGRYLNEAGRAREVVGLLEPFAKTLDPNVDVLMAWGVALAQAGRPNEALAAFGQAREIDPSNSMALVDIGTVHLLARDFPPARAAFEAALALNAGLARAHNSLGVIAAQTGNPAEAIESWKRAVELDPHDVDTLFNLGSLLMRRGEPAEARRYLELFVREAPRELYARDVARVSALLQHPNQSK